MTIPRKNAKSRNIPKTKKEKKETCKPWFPRPRTMTPTDDQIISDLPSILCESLFLEYSRC